MLIIEFSFLISLIANQPLLAVSGCHSLFSRVQKQSVADR